MCSSYLLGLVDLTVVEGQFLLRYRMEQAALGAGKVLPGLAETYASGVVYHHDWPVHLCHYPHEIQRLYGDLRPKYRLGLRGRASAFHIGAIDPGSLISL